MKKTWLVALVLALTAPASAATALAAPASEESLSFDLKTIPFSRAGSYLAISRFAAADKRPAGLFLRTVRDKPAHAEIFILEPLVDGKLAKYVEEVSPSSVKLKTDSGSVDIVFDGPAVVRVRGQGVGLRLRMWTVPPVNSAYPGPGGRWVINNSPNNIKFMLTSLKGAIRADAPWDGVKSERIVLDLLTDQSGAMEAALEEYQSAWTPRDYPGTFEEARARVEAEHRAFAEPLIKVAGPYRAGAQLAAYLLWSNVVEPQGYLKRPTMFMSKNFMVGVWSWDHCFNAMALAQAHPKLAWDQLMLFFDVQNKQGGLPDRMNERMMAWGHNKPPVHGWALQYMMRASPFFRERRQLAEIYGPLSRWTDWWFQLRDDDGDGLPQYNHGNDCGWDNATPFFAGVPLEAPDLQAYLIIQMDVLADIAKRLDKPAEARRWKKRADDLLARMLKAFWRNDHFVAFRSGDDSMTPAPGDSLLLYLPLVLGDRLPKDIRDRMIADLKQEGRFLTKHGLATESIRSSHYKADGYWRGPIWAPSTSMLVEGIAAAGDQAFASDLSRRYVDALRTSQMPENFDAVTGKDRRDPGYTWTSSAYLMLAPKATSAEAVHK